MKTKTNNDSLPVSIRKIEDIFEFAFGGVGIRKFIFFLKEANIKTLQI